MSLSVGNLGIDGLEDIEQIGTGGSSRVYRARQADLDRVVAVKVLNPGYDQSVSKRFDRERKAMGRLSLHEGIVPVYSSGLTTHGEPYLVMPYYANGSLQDQIDTGAMEWQTAVSYVDVAAETIAVAHDAGVVHLDLKPANILLTNHGAPRIADFGIAKLTSGQGASAGTTTGAAFTPAYSAPETFLDGETGPPSDVYGLGATLWALLVGHPPFLTPGDDTNLMAVIGRVVNNTVGDLRHFTPSPVCDVIERAMAKQPEDRFQTARDFSMALKNAAAASSPGFQPPPETQGTALFPAGASAAGTQTSTQILNPTQAAAQATPAAVAAAAVAGRPLLQETAQAVDGTGPPLISTPTIELDRFKAGPILFGLVALIGVIGLGLWTFSRNDSPARQGTIEIPVTAPAAPNVQSTVSASDPATPAADNGAPGSDSSTTVTTAAATPSSATTAAAETTTTVDTTTSTTENTTSSTDGSSSTTIESTTTTETTTETTTGTINPPVTTAPPTTVEVSTTPEPTDPPEPESTVPTEPPTIGDDFSTSSTVDSISVSFSADQCVFYRVRVIEDGSQSGPVTKSNRNGGTCAESYQVTIDGLQAGTLYSVSVVALNTADMPSDARVAPRRTK